MTRQEKYPETSTFHFYNANPKGRITTDCVARALSTAMKLDYNRVIMELAEISCETGYDGQDKKGIELFLKGYGWIKHRQPRKLDNTKFTGKEFCKKFDKKKNYVAMIGGHHIVAIVDGKVNDIWDSTDSCIGNYWTEG